jgi:hypothetical protein
MRSLAILCLGAFLVAPVLADWDPGDGHKMHFPQLPDEEGWDVNATFPKVLADDWTCSGTGWVEDIHFWGSWRHGDEGFIQAFRLSIHENIPGPPYSMPGEELWVWETPDFGVRPIDPPTQQGWYDPNTGEWNHPDHQAYFQYNIFLPPEMWFWQEEGTIYWLDISAFIEDPVNTHWGWKTSYLHWEDDAVYGDYPNFNWQELYDPLPPHESLDMAFVITPEPASISLLGLGLVLLRRR